MNLQYEKKRLTIAYELILIAFISLLLALLFTFPNALHLNTQFIGDGYDNYEYASYQSLAAKQVKEGTFPFSYSTYWRYPQGFNFSRGFDSYLTVVTGALITLSLGMPTAYNLTLLLLLTLNGICAYALFKGISKSILISIVGMIMYGFSFYSLTKAGSHPNLLFTGGFSLLVLFLYQFIQNKRLETKSMILFIGALLLIASGSLLYLLLSLLFGGIILLVAYLMFFEVFALLGRKIKENFALFISGASIAALSIFTLYLPHLHALLTHSFVFLDRSGVLNQVTPSLYDYITPNSYLKLQIAQLFHNPSEASIEKGVFFGWTELILFILFFISSYSKKTKVFLGILFSISFVLSLGYGKNDHFFLLPYHFLATIFPFSLLVETGRYAVIFSLIISISAILFLKSLKNSKKRVILLSFIIISLLLERLPTQFYTSSELTNEPYITAVRNTNSSAILDIPINLYYAPYDFLSFSYQKPIVNGYFHWSADGDLEKTFILKDNLLSRFICSNVDSILSDNSNGASEQIKNIQMLNFLRSYNINTIVIHRDDKFYHPVCKNVRMHLASLLAAPIPIAPTQKEMQLNLNTMETKPTFSITFPQNGIFYLDGAYVAPNKLTSFSITQNNKNLPSAYGWEINADNSMQLTPKYSIQFPVNISDTITFRSPDQISNTYFSLWYRYTATNTQSFLPQHGVQKIFDDEKATVYQLY